MVSIFTVISLLVSLLMLSFGVRASSDNAMSQVSKIARYFNLSMNQCPERIWKNYSWNDFYVFFVYPNQAVEYRWTGQTNTIHRPEFRQIQGPEMDNPFRFFEYKGQKALSLNMESISGDLMAYLMGIHESFHYKVQDGTGWAATKGAATKLGHRGLLYPLKFEPRYLRKMLFRNLIMAAITEKGRSTYLGKAKYWYEKWRASFSNDFGNFIVVDREEGTAVYVEKMAHAIANTKGGCQASEEALKNAALGFMINQYKDLPSKEEGYAIGGLASLILRFMGSSNRWQDEIISGKHPLDILLRNRPTVSDVDDLQVKGVYERQFASENKRIGAFVDGDIRRFADDNYIRVEVSTKTPFYFRPSFFVIPRVYNSTVTLVRLSDDHLFNNTIGGVTVTKNSIMLLKRIPGPCSTKAFVLVHKDHIRQYGSKDFIIGTGNIFGVLEGTMVQSKEEGATFLCQG